jgi:hypothetical protein
MAKGKNDPSGNDYLEQLQWQAQHHSRRWISARFQPKWKYKIVYRFPKAAPFDRALQFLSLIGAFSLAVYIIRSVLISNEMESPGKIFLCFFIGLVVLILFFAIRDGSKDSDHKSDQ